MPNQDIVLSIFLATGFLAGLGVNIHLLAANAVAEENRSGFRRKSHAWLIALTTVFNVSILFIAAPLAYRSLNGSSVANLFFFLSVFAPIAPSILALSIYTKGKSAKARDL